MHLLNDKLDSPMLAHVQQENSREARNSRNRTPDSFRIYRTILNYGKPIHPKKIAELSGVSYDNVQRRLSGLVRDGKIKVAGKEKVGRLNYTVYEVG